MADKKWRETWISPRHSFLAVIITDMVRIRCFRATWGGPAFSFIHLFAKFTIRNTSAIIFGKKKKERQILQVFRHWQLGTPKYILLKFEVFLQFNFSCNKYNKFYIVIELEITRLFKYLVRKSIILSYMVICNWWPYKQHIFLHAHYKV